MQLKKNLPMPQLSLCPKETTSVHQTHRPPVFNAAPFSKSVNGRNTHEKMRMVELLFMYTMRYLFNSNAALSPGTTVHVDQRPLWQTK